MMKSMLAIPATLMVSALAACNGQKENNGANEHDTCNVDTLEYPAFVIDAQREDVKVCVSDDERLRLYCCIPIPNGAGAATVPSLS